MSKKYKELTGTEKIKAQKIYVWVEGIRNFELALGCNASFPYGAGLLRRFGEDWEFSNGRVGGSFEPNEEFIIATLWNCRRYISEQLGVSVADIYNA